MYATTPAAEALVNRLQAYGVQASGEVVTSEYHDGVSYDDQVTLAELKARGGKISRVRLLTEVRYGYGRIADVSYIHATLPGGKVVPVRVDVSTNLLREVKKDFIEWAKREGVFAKGIGLLDEGNWSILY